MASKRQIEANRRNARKSTGPKTAAGKAASAANALSHGLTAAGDVLLQDESADAFESLQRDVLADLAPQDALQAVLARRIVQLLWRLDRAARLEAELFVHGELAAKRDRLRAAGPGGAVRAAFERVYADQGGADADALSKALDERDRTLEERRRAILAVDAEILLGAPTAAVLVEREESARAFDRLMRHEATLQRALNRTLAEFRSLKREAAAQADADAAADAQSDAAAQPAPADEKDFLQNEANPAHAIQPGTDSLSGTDPARPPAGGVGETPWYDHERGFLQHEANSAQPTERDDDPVPLSIPLEAPPIF